MKLEDVILVTDRSIAGEKSYLLTLEDFMTGMEGFLEDIQDMAVLVADLYRGRTDEGHLSDTICTVDQRTVKARFCRSETELKEFLRESTKAGNPAGQEALDIDRCSMKCLEVLRAYNISMAGGVLSHRLHYEAMEHSFAAGEVARNFNGHKYQVLEVLTEENLLLRNIKTNEIIVAVGAKYYARYPAEQGEAAGIKGIEWSHGVYLGNDVSGINYKEIRRKYGREIRMDEPEDCRKEALQLFQEVQNICRNKWFPTELEFRMEQILEELFGTGQEEEFMRNLYDGCYDIFFPPKKELEEGKTR